MPTTHTEITAAPANRYAPEVVAAERQSTAELHAILAMPAHLSGLETLEQLASLETLNPIFRQACGREATRARAARRGHESGVRRSGMQDDPYRVRTARDLLTETEAAQAYQASPRGRFLAALSGVEKIDPAQGDKIRAHYNRMLADERQPLDVAAVGTALALLNAVPGQAAREAIDALSELLIQTRKAA